MVWFSGADLGGGCRGCAPRSPPSPRDDLRFSNTTGILPKKKKVEKETSALPPEKSWICPWFCY